MYETVTVSQAISKGRKMITYPVTVIIFGLIGIAIYFGSKFSTEGWVIGVMIPGTFLVAWLYWSFAITKWRLWAFDNVRNVHDLQRKAVEAQLIWADGSFFEKTEIRSSADKAKWASLQGKFDQPDVFTDDLTVPTETMIYYSKSIILLQIVLMLGFLGGGIYMLITASYIIGVLLCAFSAYMLYREIQRSTDKDPQVILNKDGIQTVASGFNKWADINNDEVVTIRQGKSSTTYLRFNYPGGQERLAITELDVSKKNLENMLHTYRVRSEKQITSRPQMVSTPIG